MKKVLQISKYYYPFLGGTEQVARDMANVMLRMDNVEQKIICFNEDASDGMITCKRGDTRHEVVGGVEVIRCGCRWKLASQALSTTFSEEMRKVMDEFRPDVVILHYPKPFAAHFLLKYKKRGFRLVIYWHLDITKQKLLKRFFYVQNIKLIDRADKILGATPRHLNESEFTPYFKDKKQVFPYMIDEKQLTLTEEEKKYAADIREKHRGEKIGFFIGRHVSYKGLIYLIKASKMLGNEKIHFYIAGFGELTDGLKEQASGDPKIEFLGKIADSEKRSYLYACDMICFPSITRNEGFGLALAEGMYFGKPAVTFTIPGSGVNYVNLDGVTGIECPNGDSKAYAEAVKKLCTDDELRERYGRAARQRVMDNFTSRMFEKNLKKLINEL